MQGISQSGVTTLRNEYDAFGNQRDPIATDPNPFRYCGEYYDAEAGEITLRARQYDPGTGRFTSEDPAKDGDNWYGYCENNPVAFVDPSGLSYESNFMPGGGGGSTTPKPPTPKQPTPQRPSVADPMLQSGYTDMFWSGPDADKSKEDNRNRLVAFNLGATYLARTATDPVFNNMIFRGDNRIEVPHGRYGYVRQGGKVFHSGLDIRTLGNKTIHSTVSGTVWCLVSEEKAPDDKNKTWEWGHIL